ncbi:MAG: magnesium chelatase subunit D [Sulfitobacter sp.]
MTPWARAVTALQLVQIDPNGLGGIALNARSGPVRDAFIALLPTTSMRLHPAMTQEALTGGIDVSSSLAEGALVRQSGLLDREGMFVLAMAERTPPLIATSIATMLDARAGNCVVALDEHTEDEEPPSETLLDRLAFHLTFEGLGLQDIGAVEFAPEQALDPVDVAAPDSVLSDIVTLAVSLGITSLRAPTLALNAAKAFAALHQRNSVTEADVIAAAELVLAPRATRMPEPDAEPPDTPPEQTEAEPPKDPSSMTLPDELLLAAIETALPPDLLSKTGSNAGKNSSGSGAGKRKIGNRRGRPLPPRDTNAKADGARADLVATLRAAIPWQKLRKQSQPDRHGPIIHPTDLRYKRYEDLSDRLLIFAVDASGSAALARLAEAKGAVELLLAEAYARRDHVALISFRGEAAEVLLPPTRSLVQTKRRLAELPGGGGTPLASGLQAGFEAALNSERKGLSPVIILLTDGRSNVALDGTPNRADAARDATQIATQIAQAGIDSIVIDTGRRPEPALNRLAHALRGHYVSLPRADAHALSETVSTALSA